MKVFTSFLIGLVVLGLLYFLFELNFVAVSQTFQRTTELFSKPLVDLGEWLFRTKTLKKENQELRTQLLVFQERLLEQEQGGLPTSVKSTDRVPARVIGFVLGTGGKRIFLDQGSAQGVEVGDWVLISEKTLVGRVEAVKPNYSVVKTIFDPSLKVAAEIVSSSGSLGRGLFYFAEPEFVLDFLPREFDWKAEELALVQSSGQDGLFRAGFFLGQAQRLATSTEGQFKKAIIEPAFRLTELRTVFVVKNFFNQQ